MREAVSSVKQAARHDAMPRVIPGDVIAGMRIVLPLSRSSHPTVFVAEMAPGRARCAIRLLPQLAEREELLDELERQARIGDRLSHPLIPRVVSIGVDARTRLPFVATELVPGRDLERHVAVRRTVTIDEIILLLSQLCGVLARVHAAGAIHGDLRPRNLVVGLSALVDLHVVGFERPLSRHGRALPANPFWAAPEVFHDPSVVRPPADVWSIGLLAFWLLTGRSYWQSASERPLSAMHILRELLVKELPSASQRARALGVDWTPTFDFDVWFGRCVARDPSDRFADAEQASAQLQSVLESMRHHRLAVALPCSYSERSGSAGHALDRAMMWMLRALGSASRPREP